MRPMGDPLHDPPAAGPPATSAAASPPAGPAVVDRSRRAGERLRRLLQGPLADEPAELRQVLWRTLDEVPALQAFELLWTVVVALMAWRASGADWPLAWLAIEAACLPLRGRGVGSARSEAWRPLRMTANVLRLLAMGLGAMAALWLGDLALTALAPVLVVGVLAVVVARWAALPRLAAAVVLVDGALLWAGLAGSPLPGLAGPSCMIPAGAAAFWLLLHHNHRTLLRLLQLQFENRRLSLQDPLTGLPNRREFTERLARLREAGQPTRFAVLCMDLDGFKRVNDQHGHDAGDQLLAQVAQRFRGLLRQQDAVCRVGGDEFVVLLPGADAAVAAQVAQRLLQEVARPFTLRDGVTVQVGLSVGIALCPGDGQDGAHLLREADAALYRAKRAGKGCWRHAGALAVD